MAKELIHVGERSWWDGTVRTLCGLKSKKSQKLWFVTKATCPTCRALSEK